jgi:two-component sensor histidine kinase
MRRSESELVKTEFKESINRLISIALVHELYATQTWDTISLVELAQRILDNTIDNESLPGHQISARVEGAPVELGSDQAIPLSLVINELITNSLKHGIAPVGEGEIIVRITEDETNVNLSVINSGPPQEKPLSEIPKNSLGLQIVEALAVRQLGGTFALERSGDNTQATVCLPRRNLEG